MRNWIRRGLRPAAAALAAAVLLAMGAVFPVSAAEEEGIWLQRNEAELSEEGSLTLTAEIPRSGTYAVELEYLVREGDAELMLSVDSSPAVSAGIRLFTIWKNEQDRIQQDNQGNDIRPLQVRSPEFYRTILYRRDGGVNAVLTLELAAGSHVFDLSAPSGRFFLRNVRLISAPPLPAYSDYEAVNDGPAAREVYEKRQAEEAVLKSSPSLYPGSDRNSPRVEPNDPAVQKLNIMGGGNYKEEGHFLEWDVTVPQDGLYTLTIKYRQNSKRGLDSHRRVLIDGKVPFEELDCVAFPYGSDWEALTLGGEEPYGIYLAAGSHRITLEVVPGPIGPVLDELERLVLRMNENYRRIIMVTSTSPDPLRDYNLDKEIPELIPELQSLRDDLAACLEKLEALATDKGSESAFIHRIVAMLDDFIKKPRKIQERLDTYSSHASSLAQYVVTGKEQPLELDYLVVASPEQPEEEARAGFFETVSFRFSRFLSSFVTDYSNIGSIYEDGESQPLKVWVSLNDIGSSGVAVGRDQSQVLKSLIDRSYVQRYGQAVNLSLVSSNEALMQAVMAGAGPDVALFTPKALPANLALREALVDLNGMPGIEEIRERFYPSALKAYTLEGGLYALPETQVFNMLFYRKDILDELGLEPPETWDAFYDVIYKIQKQNLLAGVVDSSAVAGNQIGSSNSNLIYEAFLLQNGGSLYSEDMSRIALTEPEAVEAFDTWCRLYTLRELPYRFEAFNRFRTGEMPLLITTNVFANQLWAGAPELKGLWGMVPIPGTRTQDGIDRTESCLSTGAVIINRTRQLDAAYRFLDWWTSDETQLAYSQEVEATLGLSARHNTANRAAFEALEWEADYKNPLRTQWEQVEDFYASPASYYVSRNLSNAFRKVILQNANPRDTLNTYCRDMQKELDRKRHEFGLS